MNYRGLLFEFFFVWCERNRIEIMINLTPNMLIMMNRKTKFDNKIKKKSSLIYFCYGIDYV